jgi:hypothetical protein
MTQGRYTLQQQTAVLSILSNSASNHIATVSELQRRLADYVSIALQNPTFIECIGNWSVVWGPVIWKDEGSLEADNAMLAFQSPDTKDIVVAMAGTNPGSIVDAKIEDLEVGKTVPFAGAPGAEISGGASVGLQRLKAMKDPVSGQTLLDYLNALAPTNARLIFTGHSLGGALSPTLALDFTVNDNLNTASFSNVYVYPSAGPSAGNAAYAQLFAQTFPPVGTTPFDAWNQNVRNLLDIVPDAWTRISELPSIYPQLNGGNPLPCIAALVNDVILPSMNGKVYADIPSVHFTAPFNSSIGAPGSSANALWMAQTVYQHIPAYEQLLMPDLVSTLPVLLKLPRTAVVALDLWCALHHA